jgi:thiol-disulfide isomerase/thioredoxin
MTKATRTSSPPGALWRHVLTIGAALIVLALIYEGFHALAGSSKGEDFTATTLDGKTWSLAEHRGKGPLVLNFFATWCGPCKMEYPHLLELQRKHGPKGLQVVLLTDESADTLKQFPELTSAPFTYIPDAGKVSSLYGVSGIPHTFVFNRKGEMVKEIEGYDETVIKEIEQHVQ